MVMYSTLDGIAEFPEYDDAGTDGGASDPDPSWLPRMDQIDTIFLGRNAYVRWAAHWPFRKDDPTANEFERTFARFADRAEKVVFSRTLERADWPRSRIVRGDPAEEVARLRALPGGDMALGGGPRLAQSFLDRELVDELILQVFPSLVRRGRPLFALDLDPERQEDMVPKGAPGRHDFKLLEARPTSDGVLYVRYGRTK